VPETEVPEADSQLVAGLAADNANAVGPECMRPTQAREDRPAAIPEMDGEAVRLRFHIQNGDLFGCKACEE